MSMGGRLRHLVRRRMRQPLAPLRLVAALATIGNLVIVPIKLGLGWDEIVYVSQFAGYGESATFSAPRSRGVSLLVAPIVTWTASWPILRVYLALVMGILLVLAFWPWTRVLERRPYVVGIAAGLFATLPILQFYWNSAMANHLVAVGAVASVGWFVVAARDPGRSGPLIGLAASLAFTGLMRPSDTFWLAIPLLVASAVRGFRSWKSTLAVVAGTAAGVLPWLIEATIAYGGPLERLDRASEIQGGTGLTFSIVEHLDALNGPLLCRPCDDPNINWVASLWWLALPLFVATALWLAKDRPPLVLATIAAVSMSLTYLFLIDYAAPRFLLPAYALLSIPVAVLVDRLLTHRRRAVVAVVAVGLVLHLAVQGLVLLGVKNTQWKVREDYKTVSDRLEALGVVPECLVVGQQAIAIAFYSECESASPAGNNKNIDLRTMLIRVQKEPSALVVSGHGPPGWARDWERHPVRGLIAGEPWDIYLPRVRDR